MQFDWETIINSNNSMGNNCKHFTKKYLDIMQECVPRKDITIRANDNCKIWFNIELRRETRTRNRF